MNVILFIFKMKIIIYIFALKLPQAIDIVFSYTQKNCFW